MSSTPPRPRDRNDFRIAIICALPLEAEMVQSVFDKDWADEGIDFTQSEGDPNAYSNGTIGKHNVVLAYMPGMGVTSAASVAAGLRSSYHRIEVAFIVGICGVSPVHPTSHKEIVLGDCIVSTTVLQYDSGRLYPGSFERRSGTEDTLGRPNTTLRAAITKLQTAPNLKRLSTRVAYHLEVLQQEVTQIGYPGHVQDWLFRASYMHMHHDETGLCNECVNDLGVCKKDCEDLKCEASELVPRDRFRGIEGSHSIIKPEMHFGRYGSANTVLKSGIDRETLSRTENIVAFEMEGAGVWDNLPTIIIKSACDYADSHKNKKWQRYAAATAAAGLKSVLEFWRVTDVVSSPDHIILPIRSIVSINEAICKADKLVRDHYLSGGRLLIQRLSGEELDLDNCFINLALIHRSQQSNQDKDVSPFSLKARLRICSQGDDRNIPLEGLFEERTLPDKRTIRPRRIFIQGRAGIGKTTLCKKIVDDFLQGRLGSILFDRLIWISLRDLRSEEKSYGWRDLLQNVHKLTHPDWKEVEELYQSQFYKAQFLSRTLLLFDGLDEISHQWKHGNPMHEFLNTIIRDSPNVIITSRPQTNIFSMKSFDLDLETVGFTPDQVGIYIRNCVKEEETIANMEELTASKPLIQDLLRIPIQLDAFCYVWADKDCSDDGSRTDGERSTGDTFPAIERITMTTIYQSIVTELCKKDLKRLGIVDHPLRLVSLNVKRKLKRELTLLGRLAFQGMLNEVTDFSPKHWDKLGNYFYDSGVEFSEVLGLTLESLSFLRSSDHRGDHTKRNYHFIHLTFQEYFAAEYFVDCWQHNTHLLCLPLTGKSGYKTKTPTIFLREEKYSPRYNIFWRFVAGLTSDRHEFVRLFDQLCEEPIDLLGHTHRRLLMYCLSEVVPDQQEELQLFYHAQLDKLQQGLITEFETNGYSDMALQTEFPEQILCRLFQDQDFGYHGAIFRALHRRRLLQPKTLQAAACVLIGGVLKRDHDRLKVIELLVKHATICPNHVLEETFRAWFTALKDKNANMLAVDQAGLRAISAPTVAFLNALVAMALNDPDWGVRSKAVRALGAWNFEPSAVIGALLVAAPETKSARTLESATDESFKHEYLSEEQLNAMIMIAFQDNYPRAREILHLLDHRSSLPGSVVSMVIDMLVKTDSAGMKCDLLAMLGRQSVLSEEGINALVTALGDEQWCNSGNVTIQDYAIKVMEKHRCLSEKAINALVTLIFKDENPAFIRDEDPNDIIARILDKHSPLPEKITNILMVAAISHQHDGTRARAIRILGGQNPLPEEGMDILITVAFTDSNSRLRRYAIFALGRQISSSERGLNTLVSALSENDSRPLILNQYEKDYVIDALATNHPLPGGVISLLISIATSSDETTLTRARAARTLGWQQPLSAEGINILISLLKDEGPEVRAAAVRGLQRQNLACPRAIETMDKLLTDRRYVSMSKHDFNVWGPCTPVIERMIKALRAVVEDGALDIGTPRADLSRRQSTLLHGAIDALLAVVNADYEDPHAQGIALDALAHWSCLSDDAIHKLIAELKYESDRWNGAICSVLHHHKAFYGALGEVNELMWRRVWAYWRESIAWRGVEISCYVLHGALYVSFHGVPHLISSDPLRIAQLRASVADTSVDLWKP